MSEIITRTVVELEKLSLYHDLEKAYVDAGLTKKWESATFDETTRKVSFYTVPQPSGETAPVFEFTLPEVDFTEVNNAIKAETDRAKETEATITQAITDEKTRAEAVEKVVSDAVAVLNGADTVEGSVAKSVKDASDTINATIGAVEEGKTVVQMITEAKTAATYDDTEIRGIIQDNADAIEAHKEAIDAKVTTLVGDDANKSVRTIANEELAAQLIPESAKDSLNTLEEIAAWIQSHPDDASAMNAAITTLQALVGTIPEGATATDIVNYIKELVDAEKTRATGVESSLDTRLSAVETLVGDSGSVDEKIAVAKQEVIESAATDATSKANQALSDAKSYADTEIAKTNANVSANTEAIANVQADATSALNQIAAIQYATEDDIRALFA